MFLLKKKNIYFTTLAFTQLLASDKSDVQFSLHWFEINLWKVIRVAKTPFYGNATEIDVESSKGSENKASRVTQWCSVWLCMTMLVAPT